MYEELKRIIENSYSKYSNYRLFSLEEIYGFYMNKLNGMKPKEYVNNVTKKNEFFVR